MPGPGVSAAPGLGPVATAPVITPPSVPGEIASAIGQFPAQQQQYQVNQAELDAKNMEAGAKKMTVLNQLVFSNPAMAYDPHMIAAAKSAFGQLGVPAPITSIDGKEAIDTKALGAFGPAQGFIAQNLEMLLQTDPDQRGAMIEAATGQAAPQAVLDQLSKLPRKYLQSPQEATGLLTFVRQSVAQIGKPGGSIDNAIASIDATSKPLGEIGIDTGMLVSMLKPDLYAQALQGAQLQLTQARTAQQQASAQTLIQTLPAKIAAIQTTTDLKKVMEEYYPAIAAARTEQAATQASEAPSLIAERQAQTKKAIQDSDEAHARTIEINQRVTTGGASIKELQTQQTVSQQNYDRLEASYQNAIADEKATTDPATRKTLNDLAYNLKHRMERAAADAGELQTHYEDAIHRQRGGASPAGPKVTSFTKGQVYTDQHGHKAKYLGGDPKEQSSWQMQP